MALAAKKILIVGPSWVGDMVMAQSLFIVLKQKNPDCIIDVLAPAWSLPILERMPEVRAGIAMPVGHGKLQLGMRMQLGKTLQRERYDQSIVLPNSLKSALVPMFAEIPERTGWRGEMRYFLLNDIRLLIKRNYPLMVQRFVALAYPPGAELPKQLPYPKLVVNQDNVPQLLQANKLGSDQPFLALCPGAEFGPAKRWPEAHYAAVAATYIQRGWQVAIFGSANDHAVAESIKAALPLEQRPACINLAGQTALSEAVDILSMAAAVVSNDSGLMHVAAALQRPMVVVYGSTSPEFTPPLGDNVAVVQLSVDCGPCFKRECPLTENAMKCLRELKPEQVIQSLDSLC
ncbi:lipopolysaccharide heptosyltransferase II [Oceanicoccus sp. KOV_DT_Chl]|uniref:lipopolysaccharide heptosyltransferase II n=1 Tax=Oceanicoccus sp. KOV_DT_Chl TaxID=1904639 RepID=UPI000C7A09BD|nr:lipopolysaccharide heptosyltransferase II [Oceanicoccus sp. KOV_DT_Chl]